MKPKPIYVVDTMMQRFRPEDLPIIQAHILHCERRNLSLLTVRQRISRLAQIADAHPDLSVLEVSGEQIEAVIDSIRGNDGGPMKPTSRRGYISILRTFYKWAVEYGHAEKDAMARVVTPRTPTAIPRPISEADLQLAIAVAPTRTLRLWLLLGGAAGLRCAEIAGLLWDDVDLQGGLIRVTGKGDKTRTVPLVDEIVELLHEHERFRTASPNVFTDALFDEPYAAVSVTKIMSRFFRAQGMEYTAHSLRHRFGTEACESSGDIRAVQELMGHSSIEQTAQYTLVRDGRRRSVVDGMRSTS